MNIKILCFAIMATLLLVGCGSGGKSSNPAQNPNTASEPSQVLESKIQTHVISSSALKGNLLGDSAERQITVYLPKAYFASQNPLPVIYYLPGFGDTTILGMNLLNGLDAGFIGLNPAIVVVVDGVNRFGGSFYVDSPVTGQWESFVANEVVALIDKSYRTLAKPQSRGIAGHSMGGFGALNFAMKHADVFGSAYALAPGLFNKSGLGNSQMFYSSAQIDRVIEAMAAISNATGDNDVATLNSFSGDSKINFDLAYGLAFAPLEKKPFLSYPYAKIDGKIEKNETVWQLWDAGFGGIDAKLLAFKGGLQSLSGLGLDCGINDEYSWIYQGCDYLDKKLTEAGISHTYAVHSGRHQDLLPARITGYMLPFFSAKLAYQ